MNTNDLLAVLRLIQSHPTPLPNVMRLFWKLHGDSVSLGTANWRKDSSKYSTWDLSEPHLQVTVWAASTTPHSSQSKLELM